MHGSKTIVLLGEAAHPNPVSGAFQPRRRIRLVLTDNFFLPRFSSIYAHYPNSSNTPPCHKSRNTISCSFLRGGIAVFQSIGSDVCGRRGCLRRAFLPPAVVGPSSFIDGGLPRPATAENPSRRLSRASERRPHPATAWASSRRPRHCFQGRQTARLSRVQRGYAEGPVGYRQRGLCVLCQRRRGRLVGRLGHAGGDGEEEGCRLPADRNDGRPAGNCRLKLVQDCSQAEAIAFVSCLVSTPPPDTLELYPEHLPHFLRTPRSSSLLAQSELLEHIPPSAYHAPWPGLQRPFSRFAHAMVFLYWFTVISSDPDHVLPFPSPVRLISVFHHHLVINNAVSSITLSYTHCPVVSPLYSCHNIC